MALSRPGSGPLSRGSPHLGDRTGMGLVLVEFFLQRQRVLHCTNGSHRRAHEHHAPGMRDDNRCVGDIERWHLSKDLEHSRLCSAGGRG